MQGHSTTDSRSIGMSQNENLSTSAETTNIKDMKIEIEDQRFKIPTPLSSEE